MENQHKKIKGYRDLSQAEIDLMNEIKAKGNDLGELIAKLEALNCNEVDNHLSPVQVEQRYDCLGYAKKDLRQGIMWAVRGVALPDSF